MQPMYNGKAFSPTTELTQAITSTSTTIYISNPSVLPDAPNYASMGDDTKGETILYTGKTSTSLTGCTRGVEGTAREWNAGELIGRFYTNKDHDNFIENINAKLDATNITYSASKGIQMIDCTASGVRAIAVGRSTEASGDYSHAEGTYTKASGHCSHAEGKTTEASGDYSHAEGAHTEASGNYSHAEGTSTEASGYCSHAVGTFAKASAYYSHAEGTYTEASANCSHAEGNFAKASGNYSHAEGFSAVASGKNSHAQNYYTIANMSSSTAIGSYNKEMSDGDLFVIGNGSPSNRANAFRVDNKGNTYGLAAFQSTGADYAEYYEWCDENPNGDDRIGLFVTFEEDKIRIANSEDTYILGVVSGNPSVIGNSYNDNWSGMYLKDNFDRIIYEDVEVPAEYMTIQHEAEYKPIQDKTTGEIKQELVKEAYDEQILIHKAHIESRSKFNPDYNPDKEFIGREKRKEWSLVGTHGVLSVYDDGTCKVNSYCKPSEQGVATASDSGYRVLKRLTDNIIKIQIK